MSISSPWKDDLESASKTLIGMRTKYTLIREEINRLSLTSVVNSTKVEQTEKAINDFVVEPFNEMTHQIKKQEKVYQKLKDRLNEL